MAAGLNAARRVSGQDSIIIDRSQAYLGVMIDDLVTRGVSEPYRMFTSRAEYRLSLRADNADDRLTPLGLSLGCVGEERARFFADRDKKLKQARQTLDNLSLTSSAAAKHGLPVNQDGQRRSAFDLLAFPGVTMETLVGIWPELSQIDRTTALMMETDARYAVYLERQQHDIDAYRRDEQLALPETLDYEKISGLSAELRGKLAFLRPRTIGQAQRIDGMTPSALTLLAARARRA